MVGLTPLPVDVTVLMAVCNGARYLREAVDSILSQTYTDFEFLIVDDGSTDATPTILADYKDSRIRVTRFERNRGLSAALNHGLELAQTPWIARQDADDVSHPERLGRQRAYLLEHPGTVLVGSQADVLDSDGRRMSVADRSLNDVTIRWTHLFENPFVHTSVVFARDIAAQVGGFEDRFDPFCQDFALWSRMLMHGEAANLPERLASYRVTDASITGDLLDRPDTDPRRRRYDAMLETIALRNLRATFAGETFGEREAALVSRFMRGADAAQAREFVKLYFRLLRLFKERYPEAWQTSDLRRTVARQVDAFAYRVRPASRAASAAVYADALRREPTLAAYLPWGRAAALLTLGRRARRRVGALCHRLAAGR